MRARRWWARSAAVAAALTAALVAAPGVTGPAQPVGPPGAEGSAAPFPPAPTGFPLPRTVPSTGSVPSPGPAWPTSSDDEPTWPASPTGIPAPGPGTAPAPPTSTGSGGTGVLVGALLLLAAALGAGGFWLGRRRAAPAPAPAQPSPDRRLVDGLIGVHDLTPDEALRGHVEQVLRGVGVGVLRPPLGSPLDPSSSRVVEAEQALSADLVDTVARLVRPGWAGRPGLLRPADVVAYVAPTGLPPNRPTS